MITPEQQRQWFQRQAVRGKKQLPQGFHPWLDRMRAEGEMALLELPTLSRKQEAWRYTRMDALMGREYQPQDAGKDPVPASIPVASIQGLDAIRLHFLNGRYISERGAAKPAPDAALIGSLQEYLMKSPELVGAWLGHLAETRRHLFTALNTALLSSGGFIHIAAGARLDQPIEIVYDSLPANTPWSAHMRNLIVLEEGAEATVIERYVGHEQADYFENSLTEIALGEDASLNHYRISEEGCQSHHLGSTFIGLQARSRYSGEFLALGEGFCRNDCYVDFHAEGGVCRLSGLYTLGEGEHREFHLDVDHGVPGCTSREHFKGMLYGKGRAVFDGHVLVDKDAQKSDALMSNDNLLLVRDAEIDTKPQLEIYADDVKCAHGTTIGQLDERQLFYLCSRGIDQMTARKMLCMGFMGELVDQVRIPALRKYVMATIERKLDTILIER